MLKIIILFFSIVSLSLITFILIPPKTSVSRIPEGFIENQFNTGEVLLNYVEGPENGDPLLLIPGQMESWQGYKLVIPELSQRFHVFVVDLRGHGKSTHTPRSYSYTRCGDDLRVFFKKCN